jgi:transporter family-2 protein
MLVAGSLMAVQAEINGRLGAALGDGLRAGVAAAVFSFGGGLVVVAIIVACHRGGRDGVRALARGITSRGLRGRDVLGGLFGAFIVMTQGVTIPTIGVALFTVAMTAGQSSGGLWVDHRGWGPSGHQALSAPRVIAAACAVLAVVLAAGERLAQHATLTIALFALLPLLGGVGAAIQQAMNGRLAQVGGAWAATLNNFIVGFVALLVCLAASLLVPGSLDHLPSTWWLYAGGPMAGLFIFVMATTARVHGVLVLGLCLVAGQVLGAETIELVSGRTHVGVVGIAAGALTITGVLIALLIRPSTPAMRASRRTR